MQKMLNTEVSNEGRTIIKVSAIVPCQPSHKLKIDVNVIIYTTGAMIGNTENEKKKS